MEEKKLKLQGVSFMDHPRVRAVAPLVMFLLVCVLFYFLKSFLPIISSCC